MIFSNFGGMDKNVWRKLQNELKRNIIGNGCCEHIAVLTLLQTAEFCRFDTGKVTGNANPAQTLPNSPEMFKTFQKNQTNYLKSNCKKKK